jgi:hypothetical protein
MAEFLGKAPLSSDIGLFLEVGVIAMLLVGRFFFARKGRVTSHGYTLTIAIVLHSISVASIMIPSFANLINNPLTDFFSPAMILTWIHAPLGLLVLILGIYLVLDWRFRPPQDTCYKRVKLMRPLWLLWMLSVTMGIVMYLSIAI